MHKSFYNNIYTITSEDAAYYQSNIIVSLHQMYINPFHLHIKLFSKIFLTKPVKLPKFIIPIYKYIYSNLSKALSSSHKYVYHDIYIYIYIYILFKYINSYNPNISKSISYTHKPWVIIHLYQPVKIPIIIIPI